MHRALDYRLNIYTARRFNVTGNKMDPLHLITNKLKGHRNMTDANW